MAHVPAWDDLGAFIDVNDFAVMAELTPVTGQPRPVRGIFEDRHMDASLGEYVADTIDPRFEGLATEFEGIKRGDALNVPGQGDFVILTPPERDGTGMATIRMAPQ